MTEMHLSIAGLREASTDPKIVSRYMARSRYASVRDRLISLIIIKQVEQCFQQNMSIILISLMTIINACRSLSPGSNIRSSIHLPRLNAAAGCTTEHFTTPCSAEPAMDAAAPGLITTTTVHSSTTTDPAAVTTVVDTTPSSANWCSSCNRAPVPGPNQAHQWNIPLSNAQSDTHQWVIAARVPPPMAAQQQTAWAHYTTHSPAATTIDTEFAAPPTTVLVSCLHGDPTARCRAANTVACSIGSFNCASAHTTAGLLATCSHCATPELATTTISTAAAD